MNQFRFFFIESNKERGRDIRKIRAVHDSNRKMNEQFLIEENTVRMNDDDQDNHGSNSINNEEIDEYYDDDMDNNRNIKYDDDYSSDDDDPYYGILELSMIQHKSTHNILNKIKLFPMEVSYKNTRGQYPLHTWLVHMVTNML